MRNMKNLHYITSESFEDVIEAEVARVESEGKLFIYNSGGFSKHLINTGINAESISEIILRNHPTLRNSLSPGIMRATGFMHDFSKYDVGDPYHEIEGAYVILTRGEEMELVAGGCKSERREALKRMAMCLPSDGIVYEQLGGRGFPENVPYKNIFTPEMKEKLDFIRRELSSNKTPLTMGELTSPRGLESKVIIYADFTNSGDEEEISFIDRLEEVYTRHNRLSEEMDEEEVKKYHVLSNKITVEEMKKFLSDIPKFLQQTSTNLHGVMGSVSELLVVPS